MMKNPATPLPKQRPLLQILRRQEQELPANSENSPPLANADVEELDFQSLDPDFTDSGDETKNGEEGSKCLIDFDEDFVDANAASTSETGVKRRVEDNDVEEEYGNRAKHVRFDDKGEFEDSDRSEMADDSQDVDNNSDAAVCEERIATIPDGVMHLICDDSDEED